MSSQMGRHSRAAPSSYTSSVGQGTGMIWTIGCKQNRS
jgi:hypothetical protein